MAKILAGFVQDFDKQGQGVLKDCSLTNIKMFKELQINSPLWV